MKTATRRKAETPTTQIQLFPRGAVAYYAGDPWGPKLQVRFDQEKKLRKPTKDEMRAIRVNILAKKYVEEEILCCDSALVSELIQHANSGEMPKDLASGFDLSGDDVKNLRTNAEAMDLAECKEFLEDHGHDLPDPNPWAMTREEMIELIQVDHIKTGETDKATDETLRNELIEYLDTEAVDGLDAWRTAVNDNAEDAEVNEWWRVSGWFASRLDEIGEVVLDNGYGTWWGRCTTGQSMIMDGVLQRVAERFVQGE